MIKFVIEENFTHFVVKYYLNGICVDSIWSTFTKYWHSREQVEYLSEENVKSKFFRINLNNGLVRQVIGA